MLTSSKNGASSQLLSWNVIAAISSIKSSETHRETENVPTNPMGLQVDTSKFIVHALYLISDASYLRLDLLYRRC